MKKLYVLAALMMATTAAHAGNSISFEIEGHKIHIEAAKNCDSLSCIKVSAPGLSGSGFGGFKGFKGFNNDDDNDVASNDAPVSNSPPAPAPVAPSVTAPQRAAPAVSNVPAVVASTPAPAARADVAPVAPAPTAYAPKPVPVAAAPAPLPTGPLGVWATEENNGNVRVENCGQSLCGYSVKTGEKILIDMKPTDAKWTGQIHDPESGRNYDSTIAMKGPNAMRVQGCAFGAMFCGGQTWNRVS
jgi:uncharacterized protein (DUF2147 family)